MSAEPLPTPPGAVWQDGVPANLTAAAADALELLRLLGSCIGRGVWRTSQPETRDKLRGCIESLQRHLNEQCAPPGCTVAGYDAGQGVRIEVAKQMDGSIKWAVRSSGHVLGRAGEWEWEPMPSDRDDGFMARCRFGSAAEAMACLARRRGGERGPAA